MPQPSVRYYPSPAIVSPEAPPAAEEPPAAESAAENGAQQPASPVFRVGEYEVGEGFCLHLCGHPEIRY